MGFREIGLEHGYKEILGFAANGIDGPGGTSEEKQRYATYVSAATSVFVANRLDLALGALKQAAIDAGQRQAEAALQAAKLLSEASDRATTAAQQRAIESDRLTRSLRNATWGLVFATVLLVIATAALAFYE